MKWGRKQKQEQEQEQQRKKPPSSSPSAFSLSHVLPLSWISKLMQIGGKPKPKPKSQPAKPKRSTRPNSSSSPLGFRASPPRHPPDPNGFHGISTSDHLFFSRFPPSVNEAGDVPRRASAGDEASFLLQPRTASHGRRFSPSVRHNSMGELEFRPPFCKCRSDLGLTSHYILPDIRRSRDPSLTQKIPSESERSDNDPVLRRRKRRRRRRNRRVPDDHETEEGLDLRSRSPPPLKPIKTTRSEYRRFFEESVPGFDPNRTEENDSPKMDARKPFMGKIQHRRTKPKVRVCSPRAAALRAEVSRIKAAAQKREAAAAATAAEEEKSLESFAVVKSSCDPQKDFRDSMVEMISENGIGRPEELESLLACYLSLNSDEHHDVIVKVFRQVYFDFNPERVVSES